jgi:putative membrane-bound dehydrogenase-like protein
MTSRLFALALTIAPVVFAADVRPVGANGQPLNLGFESGTLQDWTASGEAFKGQPVKGPIDQNRPNGGGKHSDHTGDYWIGGYEILRDQPKGTLTSVPFKVTQPWASFLIGGGSLAGTRVEIVTKDDGKVIHTARGANRENMARSIVDLRKFDGREIFIRIVDEETPGWGHVNFDDFLFHTAEPAFANVAEKTGSDLKTDAVLYAGLPADKATQVATLPKGFELKLFAAEPDIVNPISFCIDDRGRIWVAEGRTYPTRAKDGEGQDRILVFEDTDGDGHADKRTVFMEKLNLVSGIEVGFGGVWVGAAPYFMFIPMTDGDTPKPAGEPKILLDGWGYQDTHETLNTFRWGPDGWLYGCHGVFTKSNVGKPGTPDNERTPINAGYWRYHPTRHEFEVFAEGTSNPWGIDFDAHGQLFAEACVIPHLFHVIQGARYQRQAGQHFNLHTYDDIKTIADHRHYLGQTPHGGNGKSDSAGGGHAHAGMCIPQGGFGEWEGALLMNNIHGSRINADVPVRDGSGFIGKHHADFISFNDKASQIVDLRQGPDGSIYMIDWYDLNQCHRPAREAHDFTTGRIFKVVRTGSAPKPATDLAKEGDQQLIPLMQSQDAWVRNHARRLLQERKDTLKVNVNAMKPETEQQALAALWALHVTGQLDEKGQLVFLKWPFEYVRAWTIQLAAEDRKVSPKLLSAFADLAKNDPSPVVRLYLASAAQRLPLDQRAPIVEPLLARADDTDDHNLPFMLWYAVEPMVGANPLVGADLLGKAKIQRVQEFIARRMAATAKLSP